MKKLLITVLTLAVISSCSKEAEIIPAPDNQTTVPRISPSNQKVTGNWEKKYYQGELIAYEKKNNMNLFLGDIIIPNDQLSDKPQKMYDKVMGTGVVESSSLWTNRTVNYMIDPNTPEIKKQWIITAMRNWTNSTGIRFLDVSEKTDKGDHVYIAYGTIGNNSYIGRNGGIQGLNLQDDGVGVIVHELGHTLGMYHEQSRSDRDRYIKINWDNIQEAWQPQYFNYTCADNFIVKAPKTKFDFNSIMLYASINTTAIDLSYPVMTKHNGEIWGDNVYDGTDAPSITDAKWVRLRYQHIK